jgi:glycosyltransferase involved in cell wall biosynthesis
MRVLVTGSNGLIGSEGVGAPGSSGEAAPPARPVRVLHVYSGNLYGGIETLLATLARHRALSPGVEHEFALCFDGRLSDELRDAGAVVHRLAPARFSRPWTVLHARHRLGRLLAERGPDVVVGHACWSYALAAAPARRARRAVAFWMHDRADGTHWSERLCARTPPDLAIVNSRFTAESLPRLFEPSRAEMLYYPVAASTGVDRAEARARHRPRLGAGADEVVIIQASRMEVWKGQSLLIAALGRIRDRPGWVAWIAGGAQRPHERDYLRRLEAEAGAAGVADRVRFLGQRADVPELLAAADIHCQPNLGPEPFGIAFIEALYTGLPVVSTRIGAAAEIVTEACGILVPPEDPAALADALGGLAADADLRARLGAAGPARAGELCDPASALGRLRDILADQVRPDPSARP